MHMNKRPQSGAKVSARLSTYSRSPNVVVSHASMGGQKKPPQTAPTGPLALLMRKQLRGATLGQG